MFVATRLFIGYHQYQTLVPRKPYSCLKMLCFIKNNYRPVTVTSLEFSLHNKFTTLIVSPIHYVNHTKYIHNTHALHTQLIAKKNCTKRSHIYTTHPHFATIKKTNAKEKIFFPKLKSNLLS